MWVCTANLRAGPRPPVSERTRPHPRGRGVAVLRPAPSRPAFGAPSLTILLQDPGLPDPALDARKAAMRRDFWRLRRAAAAAGGAYAAATLAAEAAALAARLPRTPRRIAGYVAAGGEIDVLPLLIALGAATGAGLCLPVVTAPEAPLGFRAWQPDAPLVAGAFGILMPDETAASCVPDLLLMPLVAVDPAGRRLGQGGGFYDRTLAAVDAGGQMPVTIGVCFAAQLTDEVPAGPFDRPLDLIQTKRGLLVPVR